MGVTIDTFQFCPVKELERQAVGQEWLIDSLWGKSAVGLIGGQPKCCKSWLGLDMAISVASATPCMGKFQVKSPGPVLVFLAEDGCAAVRNRIEAICSHRGLDINLLDLYAITEQTIRLDLAGDQQRLEATLKTIRPKLLVLDPLVRLHCGDENSAADISLLLGFLRQLQRTYNTAIVLVHHASKKHRAQPGQALRGSSDLHAFGDSNAYLTRKDDRIVLTLEHRSAKPLDPFDVQLISSDDGSATHLEVVANQTSTTPSLLPDRLLPLLINAGKPLTRTFIREKLKVNNQKLGDALTDLENKGAIMRSIKGWSVAEYPLFTKNTKEIAGNDSPVTIQHPQKNSPHTSSPC
jgi:hypothetical protein